MIPAVENNGTPQNHSFQASSHLTKPNQEHSFEQTGWLLFPMLRKRFDNRLIPVSFPTTEDSSVRHQQEEYRVRH